MMTTANNQVVNEMLNSVIENFVSELNNLVGGTSTIESIIEDALESSYADNYIGSMWTADNEQWIGRYGFDILNCIIYIRDEIGSESVDMLLNLYKNKGASRYVLDIHCWTLNWLFSEYDIETRLLEELKLEDETSEFTITEETIGAIEKVLKNAMIEHGDEDLF